MPISAFSSYDNTGAPYNLSAIVTNGHFDQAKYEQYSPMYLPITYAVSYGAIFAIYPALIVHTFLWYRRDIARQFRRTLADEKDVHSYLMRKYPEAPQWWFLAIGVVCFVLGLIGIEVLHTGLPVWAYIFSITFAALLVLPLGLLQAITNQQVYVSILEELLIGYILPGRPLALMMFRTVGSFSVGKAITYSSDLKFGHYMKVPPRLMFFAQTIASMVAVVTTIFAQQWALDNIPDVCTPHQKARFICANLDVFSTSSIFWGGIGPRRFFSPGAM
jgi:OPT family oligopeptide transporter